MGSVPPSGPLFVLSPGHAGTLCWTLWGCSRGAKIGQRLLGQGSSQALKDPPNCLMIRSTWGHLHPPHSPAPGQNCLGLDRSAHRPAQPEGAAARFVSEERDTGEDGGPHFFPGLSIFPLGAPFTAQKKGSVQPEHPSVLGKIFWGSLRGLFRGI